MNKEENQIKFCCILDKARALRWIKYQQYGDCYGDLGSIGLVARISDKISRIVNTYKNKLNDNNIDFSSESIEDNLIDIINYCAMTVMVLEDEKNNINMKK